MYHKKKVVPGLKWDSVLLTRWGPGYGRSPLTLEAWYRYTRPGPDEALLLSGIPQQTGPCMSGIEAWPMDPGWGESWIRAGIL